MEEHLFLGGSADGKWLPVDHGARRHEVTSVAAVNDEPSKVGEVIGDPRPHAVPVVETYEAITVSHGGGSETAYALNAMTPEAVRPQVVKHFGADATFEWGAEK